MKAAACASVKILVLGIGNILLKDDGAGVHALDQLAGHYEFSDNVTLMDGGTSGLKLVDAIMAADRLVVFDAVQAGSQPGTVHRLTPEDLQNTLVCKGSLHDMGILEALNCAGLLGRRPISVIIGIEPENLTDWSTTLSEAVKAGLDSMMQAALAEIRRFGGGCRPRLNQTAHITPLRS